MLKKAIIPALLSLFLPLHMSLCYGYELVVLKSANIRPYNEALEGLKSSCDCRVSEVDHPDSEQADISAEVLAMRPDAIVAIGLDALNHLQSVKDLPLIYTMIPNYQPAAGHKRNISGVNMNVSPEKYLAALIDIFPSARRIGVVYDPKNSDSFVQEASHYAQSKGIELVLRKSGRPGDVPSLIEGLRDKIDVFWMIPDPTVASPVIVKSLLLFSFQNKIPVFTFSKKYVELGAIAGLNITPFEIGIQTGELAKRILSERGAKMSLRVEAKKSTVVINNKVARKMGIKFRDDLFRRAEDVN